MSESDSSRPPDEPAGPSAAAGPRRPGPATADGNGADAAAPGEPGAPHPAERGLVPDVLVCDDGELEDVHQALVRLGESPLRVRPTELAHLEAWQRPRRLFVTSVRTGLAHGLSAAAPGPGVVAIAVAEHAAHTLCTTMLRRGFRYVIRRPVHPEALRLLLRQVLFLGREQRRVARFPFGGEVRWRRGLRRGRCAMSEISAHGCRILTQERFSLGDRVHLRVASALRDGRSIRLKGRVVRRDLGDPATRPRRSQVALTFEGLSARARADLDALLAERSSGPAPLRETTGKSAGAGGVGPALEPGPASRALPRLPPEAPAEAPAAPAPEASEPPPSRRRRPRGRWREEVVALDPSTDQVIETLMGRDLSSGGLRVEPHPSLRLGDELKLALYDPVSPEPLVLDARVARDDGKQGFGLVFQDVAPDQRVRLEELVQALPPVSTLGDDREKPEGVVLGGIVLIRSRSVPG